MAQLENNVRCCLKIWGEKRVWKPFPRNVLKGPDKTLHYGSFHGKVNSAAIDFLNIIENMSNFNS